MNFGKPVRAFIVAFALFSPLKVQAEQITWTFSSRNFNPASETTELYSYTVTGASTTTQTSPVLTPEYLSLNFGGSTLETIAAGDLPPAAFATIFSPLQLLYSYSQFTIDRDLNVTTTFSPTGELLLTHPLTGDVERWRLEVNATIGRHDAYEEFHVAATELLEGDGRLGQYPYTLYPDDEAEGVPFNATLSLGMAFWPAEGESPVHETPEPTSLVLAVLGVSGVGIGAWRRKRQLPQARTSPTNSP